MPSESPSASARSIATIAFLKARLDEKADYLGLFMPLVLDAVSAIRADSFVAHDVQVRLAERHGIALPEHTIGTLLNRAAQQRLMRRQHGRYVDAVACAVHEDIEKEKSTIEAEQRRLTDVIKSAADSSGRPLGSHEETLTCLLRFLEGHHVGMLVDGGVEQRTPDHRESAVVADLLRTVVLPDESLRGTLDRIVQGLVLYGAAFLPDLAQANRRFQDLQVFFDSVLVRQALGYEGEPAQVLMKVTIDVLRASGVKCLVFEDTVKEIKRILALYVWHLATQEGRLTLNAVPMARHFLVRGYTPADVREMVGGLDQRIAELGLRAVAMPWRERAYTADEKELSARLADPKKRRDDTEPRVLHDVDCVAAVLTLRKGFRPRALEDAKAVFVSASRRVIHNVRLWYREQSRGEGVEPMIHVQALANIACLKRPALLRDFKVQELTTLCAAALRPRRSTWDLFLKHLRNLERSRRISSEEMALAVMSELTDPLLVEAEMERDEGEDVDAATFDQVVERVREAYTREVQAEVETVKRHEQATLSSAEERVRQAQGRAEEALGREAAAANRVLEMSAALERNASRIAWLGALAAAWALGTLVVMGAVTIMLSHPSGGSVLGGVGAIVFVGMELLGVLGHVGRWRQQLESRLKTWVHGQLSGE